MDKTVLIPEMYRLGQTFQVIQSQMIDHIKHMKILLTVPAV